MNFEIGENLGTLLIILVIATALVGPVIFEQMNNTEKVSITQTDSTTSILYKNKDTEKNYLGKKLNQEQIDSLLKEFKK